VRAMAKATPNPEVLGQLLFLQSVMDAMPGEQDLILLTCQGLKCVPGVLSVEFIKAGNANSENPDRILTPVSSMNRDYGNFYFITNNSFEFDLYKPYLQNLANHVSSILDNRYLLRKLNRAYDEVELRVEKRTAELHQFEHIVSSSTDMMALLDKSYTYITANSAYLDASQKTPDEVIGHTVPEVFGEVFFNEVMRPNAERCLAGKDVNYQTWVDFPAYEPRYMDINFYPYIDKGKEVAGFVVNGRNITKRKMAEIKEQREAETIKKLLMLSDATTKSVNLDELMESVVEITRDIIDIDLAMSYLWNAESHTFIPDKSAGLARYMMPLFKTSSLSLDNTSIKDAMNTGRVLIEHNMTGLEPLKLQKDGFFDWIENVRAISLLPLVGREEYRGLIVCICFGHDLNEWGCLSDKKRELMQTISNHASIALDQATNYHESITRAMELYQKVETIETMSDISKSILSTLDIHEIIEVTAKMVSRIIPCDWVRIIEVDVDKEELNFIAGFEKGRNLHSKIITFASTNLTEVVNTRMAQYIADMRTIESPLDIERELVKQGYLSVLRTPITVKGEIIAVLGLMSKRAAAFSPGHLSTLDKLSNQVGVALDNARLMADLEEFSRGTITALAETIDAKSSWTHGHSERVTEIALRIAGEMGLSKNELNDFRIAVLLHDIGKIGTSELILDKPGRLTDEEFKEIMKHPARGVEILAPIKQLNHIVPTIRSHHEFYDGTGYPDGLKGTEIPLQARILMVADTVDAMRADRPYRKGLSKDAIITELKMCSGKQFDPEVVAAYLKTLEND